MTQHQEDKNSVKKWAKDLNSTFPKRTYRWPKEYERMISITSHQRDASCFILIPMLIYNIFSLLG